MDLKEQLTDYISTENTPTRDSLRKFPYYTENGNWKTIGSASYDDWVSGFWTGILWLGAEFSEELREQALEATKLVEPRLDQNFNIGFRYQYSWLPAYLHFMDNSFKKKALDAADRLSDCFDPNSGMICHLNKSETYISATDMLMCLPLLLWARESDRSDKDYDKILGSTLHKADRLFVKQPGSVRHRLQFDPNNGEISKVDSPQGKSGGCWSRGLAWTVKGFIQAGLSLDEPHFIDQALRLVEYHQQNSHRMIPAYDYSISRVKQPKLIDTSAAAIIASGLLTLGIARNNDNCFELGSRIVKRLVRHHRQPASESGFISGSCFVYPDGDGINEGSIWGDFYTFESLYMMEKQRLPIHLRWLVQTPAVDAA